jgi:hypothetical protein
MTPVVKQDLDAARCENPECPGDHPVVIYSKCHPGMPLGATYCRERGTMILTCVVCQATTMELAVAEATVQ